MSTFEGASKSEFSLPFGEGGLYLTVGNSTLKNEGVGEGIYTLNVVLCMLTFHGPPGAFQ